jgi:hypothetical protein
MLRKGKSGTNLVVFQDIVAAPDFLEIMEGDKAVEWWPQ